MEYLNYLLFFLAIALVAGAVYVFNFAWTVGRQALSAQIGEKNLAELKSFGEMAVRFLAQSPAFKELANEQKLDKAVADIVAYANSRGIPMSDALAHQIIESSVHIIKGEQIDITSVVSELSLSEKIDNTVDEAK